MHNSCLERKCFNHLHTCFFFFFPWTFIAEHSIIWYRKLLDHLLQSCSPSLLLTSSILTGEAEWEKEKALTRCKYCWTVAKTLLCYQHCVVTSQSTAPYWLLQGKLLPSQPGLEQVGTSTRLEGSLVLSFSIWQLWVDACFIKSRWDMNFQNYFLFQTLQLK